MKAQDEHNRLRALYRKRARWYDFTANLYYLLGFREVAYRKIAVAALQLKPGDTVVEIGCGTGLNFGLLQKVVGPQGRIIGLDLTDAMLEQAQARIRRQGWKNVSLVEVDAASYTFPRGVNGILATFALTAIPEYDAVVAHAADALGAGNRLVILELKRPAGWPDWLVKFLRLFLKPFGVKPEHETYTPWRSMEHYFNRLDLQEYYFGAVYQAVGEVDLRPGTITRKLA